MPFLVTAQHPGYPQWEIFYDELFIPNTPVLLIGQTDYNDPDLSDIYDTYFFPTTKYGDRIFEYGTCGVDINEYAQAVEYVSKFHDTVICKSKLNPYAQQMWNVIAAKFPDRTFVIDVSNDNISIIGKYADYDASTFIGDEFENIRFMLIKEQTCSVS